MALPAVAAGWVAGAGSRRDYLIGLFGSALAQGQAGPRRAGESMGEDGRELVIQLDERGVELLKGLAGPCSEFRVTPQQDGSIVLQPMSAPDVALWQSGLVDEIAGNFLLQARMIRVKPDKL